MTADETLAQVVERVREELTQRGHFTFAHVTTADARALCDAAEECARLREEHRFCALFDVRVEEWKQALRERDEARELVQLHCDAAREYAQKWDEARAEVERLLMKEAK